MWRREIEWNVLDIVEEFGVESCVDIFMKDIDKTDYFATACCMYYYVC